MKKILGVIILIALLLFIRFKILNVYVYDRIEDNVESAISNIENNLDSEDNKENRQRENIDETMILDEQGIKITAKSLKFNDLFGPELTVDIENNSGEDLTFYCDSASINDYMVDTIMAVQVVNGKKASESITFIEHDISLANIDVIADIEIVIRATLSDNYTTYFESEPIKLKTSAADTYSYEVDNIGEMMYDNNGIKIISKGLDDDISYLGKSLIVYIENNSGNDLRIQARDTSVNGYMIDPIFSCTVNDGKRAVGYITFMDTQLEDSGIETIDEIEVSFIALDYYDWSTVFETGPIILKK